MSHFDIPNHLQVRNRINIDVAVETAADPKSLSVRHHTDAMGGSCVQLSLVAEFGSHFRQCHPRNFLASLEIDDDKTMKVRKLHVHISRGPIRIRVEGYWPHALVKHCPGQLIGGRIKNRDVAAAHGTCD